MELLKDARGLLPWMVEIRRDIHRRPELGFKEERTSALVERLLVEMGLKPARIARTGLTAVIAPELGGSSVALRADMDAVPVPEETGLPFASEVPGASHACGHDAHTAMLLGAARLITSRRKALRRPVKLVFQPAEEIVPGGAQEMLAGGVLDGVGEAFAIHVSPEHSTGEIGLRPGPMMAAMDFFTLKVTGLGGHGAMPHQTRDPVHASGIVIAALQSIASRRVDPLDPVVVSICAIHGGEAFNVIPDSVEMKGTCRTLSAALHERLPGEIEDVATKAAAACGCRLAFAIDRGTPVLVNSPEKAKALGECFKSMGGAVRDIPPTMGGEDFAYLIREVPGAFAFLGVSPEGRPAEGKLHSGRFKLDEAALPWGSALLAAVAMRSE